MTRKEIQKAKNNLPHPMSYNSWTDEQKQTSRELSCREMINSVLVYNGINAATDKLCYWYQQYLKRYEKELSPEIVDRLVTEQVADFQKAETSWAKGSENLDGGPYKTIRWADE